MDKPILAIVGIACGMAAVIWGRSARYLRRVELRLEQDTGVDSDATVLARSQFRKELHTALLYGVLALASIPVSFSDRGEADVLYAFVLVPVAMAFVYGRDFIREARLFEGRASIERRAEEVLSQEELAPRRWAERLAPDDLPEVPGFNIGRMYVPGTGLLAGDFFDVYQVSPSRLAVVIGDVTGHGIEPSITAFQAKELLRVFLGEYRDPAQALEVLNQRMSVHARSEEFVSILVAVFDVDAGTLRYASAGHPSGWLWHDRDVHPARRDGAAAADGRRRGVPLTARCPATSTTSCSSTPTASPRRATATPSSARSASPRPLRRDPGIDAQALCRNLVEAARDFSSSPITDDIAVAGGASDLRSDS